MRLIEGAAEIVDLDLPGVDVVGPAQREDVDVVRGAEDARGDVGEPGVALLEQFEDAAAVVVGHHDGEVGRRRFSGADQQARGIVDEGEIAEQGDRAGVMRQCGADGRGHRSVDAGHAAVGPHRDALGVQPHQGGVAHRVGGAEYQLVTRAHRGGHRRGDMQPGGQWVGGQPVVNRRQRTAVSLRAALQPLRIGGAGGTRPGAGGLGVTRHIRPARPGGQCEHRDGRISQQSGDRTVQRGPAQHDDLPGADPVQRQRMQRGRRVRGGGLGDRRQVREVGMHPGAMSGDDDGVFGEVDVNRLVKRHRRCVGPRLPVRPTRRELFRNRIRFGHKGFAQRNVELHRSGIGGAGPGGRGQHPAGGRAPLGVEHLELLGARFGQAGADRRAHLGAEVAQLLHGLVGAGAQHLVGPVGAQHDQRHPGVVGLDDGRAQVGHRGTGRHRDRDRPPAARGQADREEAGGTFVDPHV